MCFPSAQSPFFASTEQKAFTLRCVSFNCHALSAPLRPSLTLSVEDSVDDTDGTAEILVQDFVDAVGVELVQVGGDSLAESVE